MPPTPTPTNTVDDGMSAILSFSAFFPLFYTLPTNISMIARNNTSLPFQLPMTSKSKGFYYGMCVCVLLSRLVWQRERRAYMWCRRECGGVCGVVVVCTALSLSQSLTYSSKQQAQYCNSCSCCCCCFYCCWWCWLVVRLLRELEWINTGAGQPGCMWMGLGKIESISKGYNYLGRDKRMIGGNVKKGVRKCFFCSPNPKPWLVIPVWATNCYWLLGSPWKLQTSLQMLNSPHRCKAKLKFSVGLSKGEKGKKR